MTKEPIEKIGTVTSKSVLKHTKKSWDQWVVILEKAGAQRWTHQEIAAFLFKKYKVTPWWQQIVTTGYEVHIGRRVAGRNAKGQFSIIATKTIHADKKAVWKALSSKAGIAVWLAPMSTFKLAPKSVYEREDGVYGQIRTMKAGERVRFSWQEGDWAKVTYVMLFIVGKPNGTTILAIQHEGLKDGRLREPLRDLWKKAVADIAELVSTK
jgi:uncharacterized protein YndB with AHSA1/START domain